MLRYKGEKNTFSLNFLEQLCDKQYINYLCMKDKQKVIHCGNSLIFLCEIESYLCMEQLHDIRIVYVQG